MVEFNRDYFIQTFLILAGVVVLLVLANGNLSAFTTADTTIRVDCLEPVVNDDETVLNDCTSPDSHSAGDVFYLMDEPFSFGFVQGPDDLRARWIGDWLEEEHGYTNVIMECSDSIGVDVCFNDEQQARQVYQQFGGDFVAECADDDACSGAEWVVHEVRLFSEFRQALLEGSTCTVQATGELSMDGKLQEDVTRQFSGTVEVARTSDKLDREYGCRLQYHDNHEFVDTVDVTVQFDTVFGTSDTDGDGVIDSEDECPNTAGAGSDGCPVDEGTGGTDGGDDPTSEPQPGFFQGIINYVTNLFNSFVNVFT